MGDEWLGNEKIDVEIDQLEDFCKAVMDEARLNFAPSLERGIAPMYQVVAPFEVGRFAEAVWFKDRHAQSVEATKAMLGEALRGLTSLAMGARSIAAEYEAGDAIAKATNESVLAAFNPAPGQQTIDNLPKDAKPLTEDELSDEAKEARDGKGGLPEASDPYGEKWIDKGGAGEYYIPADDEKAHDPSLNPPKPTH